MIETKTPEIGRLYHNLTDLKDSLADSVPAGDLAQEILDFLALAAGLKPVLLLGRGIDAPHWIAGA